MRSKHKPPPVLSPPNTPIVKSTLGLGTGGGASIDTPDSDGFGAIRVSFGPGYTASGNVVLQFPSPPPPLFVAGDDLFGTLTQTPAGANLTIAWTNAVLSSPSPTRFHRIFYEWF